MAKAVGIDLGTTNSVIAAWEGGQADVIPNAEGARTTPSVVAFTESGERLVGQLARRQAILNPKGTIYSAKRFIGRRFEEVSEEAKAVAFDVVSGPNGEARFNVRGKLYAPEEISAQVLRKLADDAGKFLGERVTEAVITVPAYLNDAQRQATKDAGKIAGLEVLRIINEPTAAALAYGLDKKKDETISVYDLGGGTFDVSVLEIGEGVFEVKATNGDTHLGGDDFDQRVIDWIAEEFKKEHGIDLLKDRMALQRLKEAAEKAKCELSTTLWTELIPRNTTIPTKKSEVFTTAADNQTSVEVHVLQGERPMARDNRTLGKFHLVGIPPAPRGVPQVEVTFDIDANGILNVSARDTATGKQQNITITASSGLTRDEIDRMVKDAESNAADDTKRKQEIEVRNQTDSLVYSTERTLGEHGSKLPEADRKAVEDALNEARESLKSEDVERMKRAQESLTRASHKLAEIMYREAQAKGQPGGAGGPTAGGAPSGGGPKEGEVVDAEFEDLGDKK